MSLCALPDPRSLPSGVLDAETTAVYKEILEEACAGDAVRLRERFAERDVGASQWVMEMDSADWDNSVAVFVAARCLSAAPPRAAAPMLHVILCPRLIDLENDAAYAPLVPDWIQAHWGYDPEQSFAAWMESAFGGDIGLFKEKVLREGDASRGVPAYLLTCATEGDHGNLEDSRLVALDTIACWEAMLGELQSSVRFYLGPPFERSPIAAHAHVREYFLNRKSLE